MKRRSLIIIVFGYILAVVYGIFIAQYFEAFRMMFVNSEVFMKTSFLWTGFTSVMEFKRHIVISSFLYFPQLFGFLGIVLLKEWGRKCIIFFNALSFVYTLYRMIFILHRIDTVSMVNLLIYMTIILFFSLHKIREQFSAGIFFDRKRILVVDDDRGLLKMLKTTLTRKGFDVVTAGSGEEGIKSAFKNRPDLIILDVLMPRMKGREVCVRLKQDEKTKEIPVIFLTAKDSPDDREAELAAGALMHITKPVDVPGLLNVIDKIFNPQRHGVQDI